jgi:uncharacterized protein
MPSDRHFIRIERQRASRLRQPPINTGALARCGAALGTTKLFQQFLLTIAASLFCSCGQTRKADPPALKTQGVPIISSISETGQSGNTQYAMRNTNHQSRTTTTVGYLDISFDQLSGFPASVTYEVVDSNSPSFHYAPKLADPIPAEITALNNREVAIKGFMLPLKGEVGRVQEFILLKNQAMCCFGRPPKINEWVHVRVKGKGLTPLMDEVITIYGTLQVGEYSENTQMLGLYRLQGDGMSVPRQF